MTLVGGKELQRRLEAIRSSHGQRAMMGQLGNIVVAKAKEKVPQKTRELHRSIGITDLSDDRVVIAARKDYAPDVEFGTKAHVIRPRRRRALRFAVTSAGRRLSGSPRRGASVVFARRVKHPGTRAQPYMRPARDHVKRVAPAAMRESIIVRWNRAA